MVPFTVDKGGRCEWRQKNIPPFLPLSGWETSQEKQPDGERGLWLCGTAEQQRDMAAVLYIVSIISTKVY